METSGAPVEGGKGGGLQSHATCRNVCNVQILWHDASLSFYSQSYLQGIRAAHCAGRTHARPRLSCALYAAAARVTASRAASTRGSEQALTDRPVEAKLREVDDARDRAVMKSRSPSDGAKTSRRRVCSFDVM